MVGKFLAQEWPWLSLAWAFGIGMVFIVAWGGRDVWQGAAWGMRAILALACFLTVALPMGILTWRIWLDYRRR